MADSFRDKLRHRVHRALADGSYTELPFEVLARVTGTLTHNWRQEIKRERRVDQRAESRRVIRDGLLES